MENEVRHKKRVVGYARVSTLLQDTSIDIQENEIKDYCTKNGYELIKIYKDIGKSGKSIEQRIEFQKMLLASSKKEFDAIVFTKLDRFARSLRDLLNTYEELKKNGVDIICIHNQIDTTTPNGTLLFHILGSFAEFERAIIRERLKTGLKVAYAKGKKIGRREKEIPKDELIMLYKDRKLSYRSLAKYYQVSPTLIYKRLLQYGVLYGQNTEGKKDSDNTNYH
ncbi:MAG: recombinase family protein [Candidatus Micrarchaeia archaeon]